MPASTEPDLSLPVVPRNNSSIILELPSEIVISAPTTVSIDDDVESVKKADLSIANNVLLMLHTAWKDARSIGSVCKLASATLSAVAERRKLLNMPYAGGNKASGPNVYDPID